MFELLSEIVIAAAVAPVPYPPPPAPLIALDPPPSPPQAESSASSSVNAAANLRFDRLDSVLYTIPMCPRRRSVFCAFRGSRSAAFDY